MSNQLRHYYRKRAQMLDLLGGKCVDCGSTDELEFDHKDRSKKSFNISRCYGLSLEHLKEELDKCVLRCKTCHLIKTKEIDGLKMEHGKHSMYRHAKCRCSLCVEANRIAQKKYREKKKGGLFNG